MNAMMPEMIILNFWSRKMQLVVSFPHWFGSDDNDNFDNDSYNEGDDLQFMKSIKQINTLLLVKKGQQWWTNAEIQKIVTQLAD